MWCGYGVFFVVLFWSILCCFVFVGFVCLCGAFLVCGFCFILFHLVLLYFVLFGLKYLKEQWGCSNNHQNFESIMNKLNNMLGFECKLPFILVLVKNKLCLKRKKNKIKKQDI